MASKKQEESYTLTDLTTKTVKTIVEEVDLCVRYLKHALPDGNYNITGPNINLDLFKHRGIVYPAGGEVGGKNFPRRSLKECQDVFADTDFGLARAKPLPLSGRGLIRTTSAFFSVVSKCPV